MGLFEELSNITRNEAKAGVAQFINKTEQEDGVDGTLRAQEIPGLRFLVEEGLTQLNNMEQLSERDIYVIDATMAMFVGPLTEVAIIRKFKE